jgi:hypothetical protein
MFRELIYLMSFVLVLALTGTASAGQWEIPVPDAGFDDHVLNNVGDWIYVSDAAYTGAWKSAGGDAWIDYGYYAGDIDLPALSGNNKLYPYESNPDYVYQILDETFIEGATYTLSVWLGIAWSGYDDNWSLYFTGEDHATNLSEISGNALVGSWEQVSLVYTATAADAGNKIGIKMTGAIYVTFDDVTLSYAGAELPVTITVPNAGFEDPVLAEDDWTWLDVPGWTWVGGEGPGVWHVTSTDFDPVVAPEGQNVLYTENAVGDAGGVAQVLTETFAANTDYTLTAEVGNSNYYYFAGYGVQLLAGGIVIAEDNDTLWPDYMNWATSTVQYTYDSADSALVGQPLEIRLLNLGLDKDNPPDNTVGVEFDNVTLSYEAGAETGVTIAVEEGGDIASANEMAKAGDTIEIAAGTYVLTSQIEIKDGVTYKGAGLGLPAIDGNDVTRAFAAWGDRGATNGQVDANGIGVPNLTGPIGWVLDGLTIQNCVSDAVNRQDILSAARDLLNNYTGSPYTLATAQAENGGVTDNPEWFDILSGAADDDLTDVELQAYLDANPVGSEGHLIVNDDKSDDGGAIRISNGASGTIQNCEFIACHAEDDGGAIMADADYSSNVWMNCTFIGNYTGDDGAAVRHSPDRAELTITNCAFIGNGKDADGTVVGDDGVWQCKDDDAGPITFENCLFADNACNDDRLIELKAAFALLNCTFINNVAGDKALIAVRGRAWDSTGDGVDDITTDDSIISNCLFINNTMLSDSDVIGDNRDEALVHESIPVLTKNLLSITL